MQSILASNGLCSVRWWSISKSETVLSVIFPAAFFFAQQSFSLPHITAGPLFCEQWPLIRVRERPTEGLKGPRTRSELRKCCMDCEQTTSGVIGDRPWDRRMGQGPGGCLNLARRHKEEKELRNRKEGCVCVLFPAALFAVSQIGLPSFQHDSDNDD